MISENVLCEYSEEVKKLFPDKTSLFIPVFSITDDGNIIAKQFIDGKYELKIDNVYHEFLKSIFNLIDDRFEANNLICCEDKNQSSISESEKSFINKVCNAYFKNINKSYVDDEIVNNCFDQNISVHDRNECRLYVYNLINDIIAAMYDEIAFFLKYERYIKLNDYRSLLLYIEQTSDGSSEWVTAFNYADPRTRESMWASLINGWDDFAYDRKIINTCEVIFDKESSHTGINKTYSYKEYTNKIECISSNGKFFNRDNKVFAIIAHMKDEGKTVEKRMVYFTKETLSSIKNEIYEKMHDDTDPEMAQFCKVIYYVM